MRSLQKVLTLTFALALALSTTPSASSAGFLKNYKARSEFKRRVKQQTEHVEALIRARKTLSEQVETYHETLRAKHADQLARRETIRQYFMDHWKQEGLSEGNRIIDELIKHNVRYSHLPGDAVARQMIQDLLALKVESYRLAKIEREAAQYTSEEAVIEVQYLEAVQALNELKDDETVRDPALSQALEDARARDILAETNFTRELKDEETLSHLITGLGHLAPELHAIALRSLEQ